MRPEYQSVWSKIVDFLSLAYFWARVKFFVTVSKSLFHRVMKIEFQIKLLFGFCTFIGLAVWEILVFQEKGAFKLNI